MARITIRMPAMSPSPAPAPESPPPPDTTTLDMRYLRGHVTFRFVGSVVITVRTGACCTRERGRRGASQMSLARPAWARPLASPRPPRSPHRECKTEKPEPPDARQEAPGG